MIKKVMCYGIGIALTVWFGSNVVRVAILWEMGTLVPSYCAVTIATQLPLVAIGVLLIWIARKKIKRQAKPKVQNEKA